MNKQQRLEVIKEVAKKYHDISINDIIDNFILEEFKYAGIKALHNDLNINEEFNKILILYSFEEYNPSSKIQAYIKHYCANPTIAGMQHISKHFISYLGEYYDGSSAE